MNIISRVVAAHNGANSAVIALPRKLPAACSVRNKTVKSVKNFHVEKIFESRF